jgi:hypothetical protein
MSISSALHQISAQLIDDNLEMMNRHNQLLSSLLIRLMPRFEKRHIDMMKTISNFNLSKKFLREHWIA